MTFSTGKCLCCVHLLQSPQKGIEYVLEVCVISANFTLMVLSRSLISSTEDQSSWPAKALPLLGGLVQFKSKCICRSLTTQHRGSILLTSKSPTTSWRASTIQFKSKCICRSLTTISVNRKKKISAINVSLGKNISASQLNRRYHLYVYLSWELWHAGVNYLSHA